MTTAPRGTNGCASRAWPTRNAVAGDPPGRRGAQQPLIASPVRRAAPVGQKALDVRSGMAVVDLISDKVTVDWMSSTPWSLSTTLKMNFWYHSIDDATTLMRMSLSPNSV